MPDDSQELISGQDITEESVTEAVREKLREVVKERDVYLRQRDDAQGLLERCAEDAHAMCEELASGHNHANIVEQVSGWANEIIDRADALAPSEEVLRREQIALEDALSRFAQIARGCTHGPCDPEVPCDHCIALGWLENNANAVASVYAEGVDLKNDIFVTCPCCGEEYNAHKMTDSENRYVARLRKALDDYGEHHDGCQAILRGSERQCSCGLRAVFYGKVGD